MTDKTTAAPELDGAAADGAEPELTPEQVDATWADPARKAREALGLLGYSVDSQCMPGEGSPCGASNIEHAASYFGSLSAVVARTCGQFGPEVQSCIVTGYRLATVDLDDAASPASS